MKIIYGLFDGQGKIFDPAIPNRSGPLTGYGLLPEPGETPPHYLPTYAPEDLFPLLKKSVLNNCDDIIPYLVGCRVTYSSFDTHDDWYLDIHRDGRTGYLRLRTLEEFDLGSFPFPPFSVTSFDTTSRTAILSNGTSVVLPRVSIVRAESCEFLVPDSMIAPVPA